MLFKALRVTETSDGQFRREIIERHIDALPAGEVLIRVHYSALNYKDALSATGNKGITKKYPHTPGIDAAGIVEFSLHPDVTSGEEVIVTGHDLGMNTCGGFSQYIRVPATWVMSRPDNYSLKECMIIGTAGFTAACAVHKMQLLGLKTDQGPIAVTGSTGGVGSMAVTILSKAGYQVIAVTGKPNANEYLESLGATRIETREFVNDKSGKLLLRPRWAGAIDTVGGNTLNTLLKACQPEGCIVSTGLVGSAELDATIYPFILNGVSLLGIGSAETPSETRALIWNKLGTEWLIKNKLTAIAREVDLEELNATYIDSILEGKIMGRIVVTLK